MANADVRLSLWSDKNFSGRRIAIRRGGIAIRDLGAFRFDDALSSFRLRNVNNSNEVTLLLFSGTDFRGRHVAYRGNTSVANLAANNFNNTASSLIVVGRRLTDTEISQIRNTRRPPRDIVIIRQ